MGSVPEFPLCLPYRDDKSPPVTAIFISVNLQEHSFCNIHLQPRCLNSMNNTVPQSGGRVRLFKRLFLLLSGRGTVEQILSLIVYLEFCRDSYWRCWITTFRAGGGRNFTYSQIIKLYFKLFNKSPTVGKIYVQIGAPSHPIKGRDRT